MESITQIEPLEVNIRLFNRHTGTCKHTETFLELNKSFSDIEIIKNIISCAYNERPLIIIPKFKNKLRAINSLVEKGLIHYQDGEFYFTF